MPTYDRSSASLEKVRTEVLVVGAYRGNVLTPEAKKVDSAMKGALKRHISRARSVGWATRKPFVGDVRDAAIFPTLGAIGAQEVMVVGLGPQQEVSAEQIRRAAGTAARHTNGYRRVAIAIGAEVESAERAVVEGFELGAYAFSRYKSTQPKKTEKVVLLGGPAAELIERAVIYSEATSWARDIVNESPSLRGPEAFAAAVTSKAKGSGIKVEVFDEAALAEKGMNGILSVGKGSANPPCLAVLTYSPRGAKGHVGLIGKGITFDSGGLSIKTAEGMETMKMDCTGAAAVAAAMFALPKLGAKIKVTAAIALAENMLGGKAVKPGDVIVHYGGRTSEVLNTDAEGRLVLADALGYIEEQGPDAMVDIATLTGGMMIALGTRYAGFFANDLALAEQLKEASAQSGEGAWQMPLLHEYRETLDSAVADVKNSAGTRYGAPIFGALFLNDFVGETPWAHIDIAGPAWAAKGEHYLPIGATGFGARLLLEWIEARATS